MKVLIKLLVFLKQFFETTASHIDKFIDRLIFIYTKKRNKKYIKKYIKQYRELVVEEMQKMGATKEDLKLLQDADGIIVNSIVAKRKPKDVAWAIMQ